MQPVSAQAPSATSTRALSRTCLRVSRSRGEATSPSMNATSRSLSLLAPLMKGNACTSTRSKRPTISFSLKMTDSRQPAHPVMPKNPTRSLLLGFSVSFTDVLLDCVPAEHRAVYAGVLAADHAVAALAGAAVHQALHGQVEPLLGQPLLPEDLTGDAHHDRRAAEEGRGLLRGEAGLAHEVGHEALTGGDGAAALHGVEGNIYGAVCAPAFDVALEEQLAWAVKAEEGDHLPVIGAVAEDVLHDTPQGRHAAAASHQDQVLSPALGQGEAVAVWATDEQGVADPTVAKRSRHIADPANVKSGGAAAPGGDGDGRLSYPHDGELKELSGFVVKAKIQRQGYAVGGLLDAVQHPYRHGDQNVVTSSHLHG